MAKKEISEEVLQRLLESHERVTQMEEQAAEQKVRNAKAQLKVLDSTSAILSSWGPMLVVFGVAAAASAPMLADVAWIYGDLMAAMLAAIGKISTLTGGVITGRTMLNKWVDKKRKETLEIIGPNPQQLLLTE